MRELAAWLGEFSPEVLHKIKAKRRAKVIRILLFDLLLAVAVFMSREAFVGKPFAFSVYVTVGVLILLMPLIVSPAAVLFRKPWIGTVEGVKINAQVRAVHGMKREYGNKVTSVRITNEMYAFYDVSDASGRHREITMPARYSHCFLKGDRIAVFAELEYPVNLTEHKGGAALCPLCASILHYAHKEECLHCGCRFDRNVKY